MFYYAILAHVSVEGRLGNGKVAPGVSDDVESLPWLLGFCRFFFGSQRNKGASSGDGIAVWSQGTVPMFPARIRYPLGGLHTPFQSQLVLIKLIL